MKGLDMFRSRFARLNTVLAVAVVTCTMAGCGRSGRMAYTSEDAGSQQAAEAAPSVDPALVAAYMSALSAQTNGEQDNSLGTLNANRYDPNSIANPFGRYGNSYSPDSIRNPYGRYGNPYSPESATNPYAVNAPRLYGADGTYLGKMSANKFDPDSISNPYGRYGSKYSPDSVNNPYGRFGSPYSPYSSRNPYSTQPPQLRKP